MTDRNAAELYLLFMVLVWALNFSVIKYSLAEIDPLSFNAIRFSLGIMLMWVVVGFRKLKIRIERKDFGKMILLGILGTLLYQMLFIVGINRTNASNAAVMLGMIPIWIALLTHLFTDEKMYRTQAIGVITAFLGVALIMGGGEEGLTLQSQTLLGDLIIVSAALVFAVYTLISRSMLAIYSSLTLATVVMTVGGVMLIIVAIPSLIRLDFHAISLITYGGAAYSGFFAIGIALLVWNFGIKSVGTVRTSTWQNMVPVFGVLFGLIFLGEKLHFLQYLGCLLTIGGIILSRTKSKQILS